MRKSNFFTIIFSVVFLFSPVFSFAQNITDDLSIRVSPDNPSPGQSVTISLSSLATNIDLSKTIWTIDGKIVNSGTGIKSITTVAPPAGSSDTVKVTVTTQTGLVMEKSVDISTSGDVDLIWEATDGYTPPFYRGKTLPIKQSYIRVVAITNIRSSNGGNEKSSNFVYKRRKDGTVSPGQSGFGKDNIIFTNGVLDADNRIDVSASDGDKTVAGSITITPFQPEIIFYRYDNLNERGMYESSLGQNNNIKASRLQVIAEPYFLSKDFKKNPNINMTWKLNNTPVNAPLKNILGIDASVAGSFSVNVEYNDTQKLFRDIKAGINFNSK
jgi:hypothetical protein